MVSPGPCLALLASILLVACAVTPEPDARVSFAATEQLRCHALEAAVDSLVPRRAAERLVLHDSTNAVTRPLSDQTLAAIPDLDPTTLSSFYATNSVRRPSCAMLPSGASVVLLTDSARKSLPRNPIEYWSTFYAAFPQTTGITWTSGIGVSRDGDQALLRLAHGCGSLCGRGYIVLVVRSRDGQWRVRYAQLQWVS